MTKLTYFTLALGATISDLSSADPVVSGGLELYREGIENAQETGRQWLNYNQLPNWIDPADFNDDMGMVPPVCLNIMEIKHRGGSGNDDNDSGYCQLLKKCWFTKDSIINDSEGPHCANTCEKLLQFYVPGECDGGEFRDNQRYFAVYHEATNTEPAKLCAKFNMVLKQEERGIHPDHPDYIEPCVVLYIQKFLDTFQADPRDRPVCQKVLDRGIIMWQGEQIHPVCEAMWSCMHSKMWLSDGPVDKRLTQHRPHCFFTCNNLYRDYVKGACDDLSPEGNLRGMRFNYYRGNAAAGAPDQVCVKDAIQKAHVSGWFEDYPCFDIGHERFWEWQDKWGDEPQA